MSVDPVLRLVHGWFVFCFLVACFGQMLLISQGNRHWSVGPILMARDEGLDDVFVFLKRIYV